MGAAQSSNTAKSVAKIANSISSNTSTTNSQVQSVKDTVEINDCNIGHGVNIDIVQQTIAKSRQIIDAFQQTNIQNNIAQQMQQEAQSTVGSLGIGYAEASNYVSTYASTTNDVVNMVYTFNSQAAFYNTTIVCDGSTIGGEFNIDLSTISNFWNDQGVTSQQITSIANSIDQKISQTAKSKVEGLAGFLIGLIALIGAVIYAIAAPVGEGLSSMKVMLAIFMLFGIILLIIWLWLIEWRPFFGPLTTCVLSGTLLKDQCTPQNCKDPKPTVINVDHPPLRYLYGLIARGAPRSQTAYGMLNMAIYNGLQGDIGKYNQGFNAAQYFNFADIKNDNLDKWKIDTSFPGYGVEQMPNPLFVPTITLEDKDKKKYDAVYTIPPEYIVQNPNTPSGDNAGSASPSVYMGGQELYMKKSDYDTAVKNNDIGTLKQVLAVLNDGTWSKYLSSGTSDEQLKKIKHARFVLALGLGMDVNVYIDDDEEVIVGNQVMLAKDAQGSAYKFSNFRSPPFNDMSYGITGSGTISGMIGTCSSRTNNVAKFFLNGGNYMMLVILIIVFGVFGWLALRKKK